MESILAIVKEYGFEGLTSLALGWFIVFMYKLHHRERKDWYQGQERQADKLADKLEKIIVSIHNHDSNK